MGSMGMLGWLWPTLIILGLIVLAVGVIALSRHRGAASSRARPPARSSTSATPAARSTTPSTSTPRRSCMSPGPISRSPRVALGLGWAPPPSPPAPTGWVATSASVDGGRLQPAVTGRTAAPTAGPRPARRAAAGRAHRRGGGAGWPGTTPAALGYNGTSPGPTLRVRPGDELAVRLTNGSTSPPTCTPTACASPRRATATTPSCGSTRGARSTTSTDPADHPAGTHWYHPHHHGLVADQVFGGLVGALVVERRSRPRPRRRATGCCSSPTPPSTPTAAVADPGADGAGDGPPGRAAPGQRPAPTRHRRRPGGDVQRWRIDQRVQLACPGAAPRRPRPHPDRARRDLPARARRPTTACCSLPATAPTSSSGPADPAATPLRRRARRPRHASPWAWAAHGGASRPGTLTTLVTSDRHRRRTAAAALPANAASGDEPVGRSGRRQIAFTMGMGGMRGGMGTRRTGMTFTIDGRTLRSRPDDQTVALGCDRGMDDHQPEPARPSVPPARVAVHRPRLQRRHATHRHPPGRRPRPRPRVGANPHPVHRPPGTQRLSLPHPRPRGRRDDGHLRCPLNSGHLATSAAHRGRRAQREARVR